MITGGGVRSCGRVTAGVCAFIVTVVALNGCRENNVAPAPQQAAPPAIRFTPGDAVVYDTWVLDDYNYPLSSTETRSSWHVLSVTGQYQGESGVTVILDSLSSRGTSVSADTVYLAMTSDGDLLYYGFLAGIFKRRTGQSIPAHWDRLVNFSGGLNNVWTVGTMDSLGEETVLGTFEATQDFFSAAVNGVPSVFPAYRIDLTGPSLYYSLWITTTPPAVVRLLEESGPESNGMLRDVVSIQTGTRATAKH